MFLFNNIYLCLFVQYINTLYYIHKLYILYILLLYIQIDE